MPRPAQRLAERAGLLGAVEARNPQPVEHPRVGRGALDEEALRGKEVAVARDQLVPGLAGDLLAVEGAELHQAGARAQARDFLRGRRRRRDLRDFRGLGRGSEGLGRSGRWKGSRSHLRSDRHRLGARGREVRRPVARARARGGGRQVRGHSQLDTLRVGIVNERRDLLLRRHRQVGALAKQPLRQRRRSGLHQLTLRRVLSLEHRRWRRGRRRRSRRRLRAPGKDGIDLEALMRRLQAAGIRRLDAGWAFHRLDDRHLAGVARAEAVGPEAQGSDQPEKDRGPGELSHALGDQAVGGAARNGLVVVAV